MQHINFLAMYSDWNSPRKDAISSDSKHELLEEVDHKNTRDVWRDSGSSDLF